MEDLDLNELDPNIRRVVAWLRSRDFETCDSGDGKAKFADGKEPCTCGALPFPHVFVQVAPEQAVAEARRLAAALRADHGIFPLPQGDDVEEGSFPQVGVSYDVCDDIAIVYLFGVADTDLAE